MEFLGKLTAKQAKYFIKKTEGKSRIKRDGPVFFFSAPVKVAGDERTIFAIVASRWGEASPPDT
ncbi:MAG: hypothetical protein ABSF34_12410 [Verrucomicrobiota bacterium]